MKANLLIRSVSMLLALVLLAAPLQAATLTFGVVPQESAGRLAEQWTPLMRLLSAELGVAVRFATAPDIPSFERRVLEGQYDIVYMNPYHYVEFSSSPGYRAIAREGGKRIHGIVVVADGNPATGLQALEGQTIAFPAPAAFAATLLVRAELERLGVRYTPQFVGSHESVYLNVAKGFAVAGGGIERTYHRALKTGLEGCGCCGAPRALRRMPLRCIRTLHPSASGDCNNCSSNLIRAKQADPCWSASMCRPSYRRSIVIGMMFAVLVST